MAANILNKIDINDAVFIIFITLIAYKYTLYIEKIVDLIPWDEAGHFRSGVYLLQEWPIDPNWAPLYSIWYFILHTIIANHLALFYINIKILFYLISLTCYIYLRRLGVYPFIAFILSIMFMVTGKDAGFWSPSFSNNFGLLIMLIFLILSTYLKRYDHVCLVLTVGFLLLSYVRPEYFISFLLLLICFPIYLYYRKQGKKIVFFKMISYLPYYSVMAAIYYIFGNPMGWRSWMAFKDNFTGSYVMRNKLLINIYADNNMDKIMNAVFNKSDNIISAAFANFPELIKHIVYNFLIYVKQAISSFAIFFPHEPIYSFVSYNNIMFYSLKYIVVLFILGFFIPFLIIKRQKLSLLIRTEKFRIWLIVFIAIAIPTSCTALFLFAHIRYLVYLKMVLVILLAMCASFVVPKNIIGSTQQVIVTILIGLNTLLLIPNIAYGIYPIIKKREIKAHQVKLPHLLAIKYIKSFKIDRPVVLFLYFNDLAIYLPSNYSCVPLWQKNDLFMDFIKKKNINMILIYPPERNGFINSDHQAKLFFAHYGEQGFQKRLVPSSDAELYIKNDLFYGINH